MQKRLLNALPALLFAISGIAVSAVIESIHAELQADVTYTSFCNINSGINCDKVLTSDCAYFLCVTVSRWALLFYVAVTGGLAAAVWLAKARQRETAARWVFGATALGLSFSVYMAVVSFFVLNTVCLMCSALYVVSLGLFFSAWRLRTVASVARTGHAKAAAGASGDRNVVAIGVGAGLLLVVSALASIVGAGGGKRLSAAEIREQKPGVYRWFRERPTVTVSPGGHARGPADAPVTLVEFSDFSCPHCARLDATIAQMMRDEKPAVRVVFRHFPLSADCNPAAKATIHAAACLAAVASECAAEQGEFWQYQHTLFSNQDRFARAELVAYARDLGLDIDAFDRCLEGDEARERVRRDAEEGARLGVQSTPTLFLNGRRIEGAPKGDVLVDAITLAREDARGERP